MIQIFRPLAFTLGLAALAPLAITLAPLPVLAQAQQSDEAQQVALTDAQVQAYLGAQSEMAAAVGKQPEGGADKPDPKVQAKLEAIAKKYKFASYDDYELIEANIGLVVDGVDPQSKKYVGADVVLKGEMAEIKADKSMAPADKKQALEEMDGALKAVQPLKYPANVDIVVKYYDKLAAASGQTD